MLSQILNFPSTEKSLHTIGKHNYILKLVYLAICVVKDTLLELLPEKSLDRMHDLTPCC